MSSTSFDDKQSQPHISLYAEAAIGQNLAKELPTVSTGAKSPTSTGFFDQHVKFSNETKKESVEEGNDSFDVFRPLKVKNYKNGLKKPNTTSTNKFKKKKVTSSNRICPYFSKRRSPISSKEDRDLKLAIARSLEDISPSKSSSEGVLNDIANENKPTDTLHERKPIKQPSNFLKSSTSKTKKNSANTLLFRRTGEERQEIIIKKIGILLLEKENVHDQILEKLDINLLSSNLEGAWDKDSTLWELSKIEVNNLTEFYVSKLKKYIDQPSVVIDQPSVVIDQPSVVIDQPSVGIDQPSVGIDQPSVVIDQPSVGIDQPSVGIDQPSVGIDQPSVGIDQPSVGIVQPSVVVDQSSVPLDQPTFATEQPLFIMSNADSVKNS